MIVLKSMKYFHAMKYFSCVYPLMKPLLKWQNIVSPGCWQAFPTRHRKVWYEPFLLRLVGTAYNPSSAFLGIILIE